jgi:hypothetical protein
MLRRHQVDTIFALPAERRAVRAFYDAGEALRVIHTSMAAAYMAFGHAGQRQCGAYAVVPGPGFLNTTAAPPPRIGVQRPDRPDLIGAASCCTKPRPAPIPAADNGRRGSSTRRKPASSSMAFRQLRGTPGRAEIPPDVQRS